MELHEQGPEINGPTLSSLFIIWLNIYVEQTFKTYPCFMQAPSHTAMLLQVEEQKTAMAKKVKINKEV